MERILAVTFAASDALKLQAAAEMFLKPKVELMLFFRQLLELPAVVDVERPSLAFAICESSHYCFFICLRT